MQSIESINIVISCNGLHVSLHDRSESVMRLRPNDDYGVHKAVKQCRGASGAHSRCMLMYTFRDYNVSLV